MQVNKDGAISYRDCQEVELDSRLFDLSSPREWMEYVEATEGRSGAYTVIRCDLSSNNNKKRIWGRGFHKRRLCQSYCALEHVDVNNNKQQLDSAMNTTHVILESLWNQSLMIFNNTSDDDDTMYTIMLTILWQKRVEPIRSILVYGHACCSGKPVAANAHCISDPVTATLALSWSGKELPKRYNHHPEAKQSSWCRRRRPLEQTFKMNEVGEVLLTKRVGDETHILEGLTSNIFFLYPDNKLRSANRGVLKGYARKLVLDCATRLGFPYDPTPVRVQDASFWKEVFLTSSIRLVVPVKQILAPNEAGEFHELWSANGYDFSRGNLLYKELLKDDREL